MNNNTINRLTPHRIFYNWSNGDAETFTKDLTATGHFNRQDVDGLMQNTEAIITYWVEKFPFFITFDGRESWTNSLENLWVLEQQLEDFLESENYKF
mgnify:FL=1